MAATQRAQAQVAGELCAPASSAIVLDAVFGSVTKADSGLDAGLDAGWAGAGAGLAAAPRGALEAGWPLALAPLAASLRARCEASMPLVRLPYLLLQLAEAREGRQQALLVGLGVVDARHQRLGDLVERLRCPAAGARTRLSVSSSLVTCAAG
jgi:hypothetical protein